MLKYLIIALALTACTQELPAPAPITIVDSKAPNGSVQASSEIAPSQVLRPIVSELCYKGIVYLLIGAAVTPRLGPATGLPMSCEQAAQ